MKNIKMLGGKPLIAYPIELARQVARIDRIIVSTDHPEIKAVAEQFGAEVPFVRPADISEDVSSELVTDHALRYMIDQGYKADIAVTMTPCTPFTEAADLEKGINLLEKNPEWDSVVTVIKAQEYPHWMIDFSPEKPCKTLLGNSLDGKYNVSQNLKIFYYPAGAFYVNRVDSFLAKPSMYGQTWGAVELDLEKHVDIDIPADFAVAEERVKALGNEKGKAANCQR